ncbi:RTC4-like domain-containing protein [Trichoderma austrokoningii]
MTATPPARRVGLSIRHSPGQLLKKIPNTETKTAVAAAATTKTTTTAAKTTTATTNAKTATTAAPKPDLKPRGGRSQLKIPEPFPEDIFAPPLASSDVEDDDDDDDNDNGGETAEKAEASLDTNEQAHLYADSSDDDAPPRGDILPTKFKLSSQNSRHQSLRTRSQETNATSQLPEASDDVEPGSRKRKRLAGPSNEKGSPKKNGSHLTNSQGFVKKPKVKATFGGRRSINSQEIRKPKVSEEPSLPKVRFPMSEEPTLPILRPLEYSAIKSIRKSAQFIVPDSDDFSSPIKQRPLRQRLLHVHYGNNSDTDEENNNNNDTNDDNDENNNGDIAIPSQPKFTTDKTEPGKKNKPKEKRRQNPLLRLGKKTAASKLQTSKEASPKSPSPPPARFVMPAQFSDFKTRDRLSGGDGNGIDMDKGELSDAGSNSSSSSSDLSSLGDIFPDKEAPKDGQALCPWCGASVDTQQLKQFSEGRQRLSVKMQTKFCESHRKTSAQQAYESKAYPDVQWESLTERFASHRARLLGIINGEQQKSHYRAALADKISLGKGRAMTKEENLNPGYYGPRGFNMMCDYLVAEFGDLLKKKAIHDKVIAGRGPPAFIQSVLVPELGVQLIMEDMHVSPEQARAILEESKALGELVHAEI